eukprot:s786_g22.t3
MQEQQDARARDADYVAQLQRKTFNTFGAARPPPVDSVTLEAPIETYGSRGHPQLCRRPCIRFAKGECTLGDACGYCHLSHESRFSFDKRQRALLQEMETGSLLMCVCVFLPNLPGVGRWLRSFREMSLQLLYFVIMAAGLPKIQREKEINVWEVIKVAQEGEETRFPGFPTQLFQEMVGRWASTAESVQRRDIRLLDRTFKKLPLAALLAHLAVRGGEFQALPEQIELLRSTLGYKKTPEGGIVSLGVFHGQEMDRFNVLIQCVQSTLVTLGRAIKGFVDMYNAFLLQKLPPNWGEVAYPCLKPLNSWFTDFQERIAFMARWLHNGPPASFWVPCFYFPQGFMTCAKQVHARKTKIPIDDLVFWQEPTNGTDPMDCKRPDVGVNVHGFFLQGAGWDVETVKMVESEKAVLFKELPITWIQVVEEARCSLRRRS